MVFKFCFEPFLPKPIRSAAILENVSLISQFSYYEIFHIPYLSKRIGLSRKDSEQNLKTLMLANQKLKRIANRTIFDRDMVDERYRNGKIVRLMTDIFQDGGRTDRFRKKRFKTKFEDHHVGYSETQTNCKSDYIRQRYGR